ncbi:GNAT family N-acetyltransferase [Solibacillus daqui]|uniref:GNAT family N-acetyltransferase n=1 Tax=Solibacillus daqui TaxID=2912187 RepID=UPI0023662240|nr:GNAT family N-acetyltransferase [Solibacillus daqui]
MSIKPITIHNRKRVHQFFKEHWGSTQMIISSGIYNCDQLDGYIYEKDEKILGLLTYVFHEDVLEVISLDSVIEGQGIGSKLMQEVELLAKHKGMLKITLLTTNDNINALKFYQKKGYRIVKVIPNAVAKACMIKPSIPLIGYEAIPLHDELELVKLLIKAGQ